MKNLIKDWGPYGFLVWKKICLALTRWSWMCAWIYCLLLIGWRPFLIILSILIDLDDAGHPFYTVVSVLYMIHTVLLHFTPELPHLEYCKRIGWEDRANLDASWSPSKKCYDQRAAQPCFPRSKGQHSSEMMARIYCCAQQRSIRPE